MSQAPAPPANDDSMAAAAAQTSTEMVPARRPLQTSPGCFACFMMLFGGNKAQQRDSMSRARAIIYDGIPRGRKSAEAAEVTKPPEQEEEKPPPPQAVEEATPPEPEEAVEEATPPEPEEVAEVPAPSEPSEFSSSSSEVTDSDFEEETILEEEEQQKQEDEPVRQKRHKKKLQRLAGSQVWGDSETRMVRTYDDAIEKVFADYERLGHIKKTVARRKIVIEIFEYLRIIRDTLLALAKGERLNLSNAFGHGTEGCTRLARLLVVLNGGVDPKGKPSGGLMLLQQSDPLLGSSDRRQIVEGCLKAYSTCAGVLNYKKLQSCIQAVKEERKESHSLALGIAVRLAHRASMARASVLKRASMRQTCTILVLIPEEIAEIICENDITRLMHDGEGGPLVIQIFVNASDTLENVRIKIFEVIAIPVSWQKAFRRDGELLKEDATMQDLSLLVTERTPRIALEAAQSEGFPFEHPNYKVDTAWPAEEGDSEEYTVSLQDVDSPTPSITLQGRRAALSPFMEVTLTGDAAAGILIPETAKRFAYIYPERSGVYETSCEGDLLQMILIHGGFAYISEDGGLLRVNALSLSGLGRIQWGVRHPWQFKANELKSQGRFQPIQGGESAQAADVPKHMCFLAPGEKLGENAVLTSIAGGVAYLFNQDMTPHVADCCFMLQGADDACMHHTPSGDAELDEYMRIYAKPWEKTESAEASFKGRPSIATVLKTRIKSATK